MTRREWRWALVVSASITALALLPYLVSWAVTPGGCHYTGLLINPIDGHSYLAKMGQGAAGAWLFKLPYIAENHRPVFVYQFYLALGHLAPDGRPESLLLVYHLARIVFGMMLLMAVYYAASMFTPSIPQRRMSLLLVGLGSGLGWLIGGGPDVTVPESITFASLLVNAHFGVTLLLSLMVIVGLTVAPNHWSWWVVVGWGALWLTWIQPLIVPMVATVAGLWLAIPSIGVRWRHLRGLRPIERETNTPKKPAPIFISKDHIGRFALFILVSSPFLLYDVWLARTDPYVGRWMTQNVTPSPPAWQWLLAYGILLPLAAIGANRAWRRRNPPDRLLLVWIAVQVAFMAIPVPLQRRMSTGLHLPIAFLAALGVCEVLMPKLRGRLRRWLPAAVLIWAFPSNLILMLAGVNGVLNGNPYLVLSDAQRQAMAWLEENASSSSVVLADVELGTVVPAWGGGARVVYGHPFETLDAEFVRQKVTRTIWPRSR